MKFENKSSKTDHDEERQILTILVRVDDTQRGTADSLRELKLEIIIKLGLEVEFPTEIFFRFFRFLIFFGFRFFPAAEKTEKNEKREKTNPNQKAFYWAFLRKKSAC